MQKHTSLTILGARGTIPVDGINFVKYGGATACVLIKIGGEIIVMDGGTGILKLPRYLCDDEKTFTVLLSHSHIDHMYGIPSCKTFFDHSSKIDIFFQKSGELCAKDQFYLMMSPPLWPVTMDISKAEISFNTITNPTFNIGAVTVETFQLNHPDGCIAYKLSFGETSIVYATDFEVDDKAEDFYSFAKDCSLLICDAQYSPKQILRCKGFGHNSWEQACEISTCCNAKRTLLFHHSPDNNDEVLDAAQQDFQKKYPLCSFAQDEQTIDLY